MQDDAQILKEFLIESLEGLDGADRDLLSLEERPKDRALLDNIFRAFHTLKGASGFFGFTQLESLTHKSEGLLSRMRDGELQVTDAVVSALLSTVDALRQLLSDIEEDGAESERSYDELSRAIDAILEGRVVGVAPQVESSDEEVAGDVDDPAAKSKVADESLRVNVRQLDRLMNLVGELVLARNQIIQFRREETDAAFGMTMQRLNHITTELQEEVMKTRMQPISSVWGKFPRIVRDLARMCGKEVSLVMHGKETELDKTILEAIRDPLTHVLRNAVDHGIESRDVRVAAGKNPVGELSLKAYHEGGQVILEVADDGGGIDPETIADVAVKRGVVTTEQLQRMSEREIIHLIFRPGFSSVETVSKVSGRGVGMDVVRTNIEKIGGSLDLQSTLGQGMSMRIKIPLTLAIIPALLVVAQGERFAIPQVNLVELVRVERDTEGGSIEWLNDVPVYRLRGDLLPLVYLSEILGMPRSEPGDAENIVVLQAEGCSFGLVVDEISDTEEIVVKPIDQQLKSVQVYAGATIFGDGRVGLILDVHGVANRASVLAEDAEKETEAERGQRLLEQGTATTRVLILQHGVDYRLTIPVADVERLEEMPRDNVEFASGREVFQYRGGVMPLVRLDEHLAMRGEPAAVPGAPLQVLVFRDGEGMVGLVVDSIVDVVEESLAVQQDGSDPVLRGTAVVQGSVTDVLDSVAILEVMEV